MIAPSSNPFTEPMERELFCSLLFSAGNATRTKTSSQKGQPLPPRGPTAGTRNSPVYVDRRFFKENCLGDRRSIPTLPGALKKEGEKKTPPSRQRETTFSALLPPV
eukprot:TRINITY_DN11118_c1_g2_i1.p1 TRINITY_DN11118_c1_g2~~TRINITY_DN11118_c1_g2_i1.p1  ORF type:complete len:106 (-),score=0.74 TRINITY_DN11118_c1_g2_i1:505-822(-)